MSSDTRRFDASYEEQVVLRSGKKAMLRLIRPSDRAMLVKGFYRLSPQSRYRRFLTTKDKLSESELDYLTQVDGENHFAIGIGYRKFRVITDGIGIGRFVRLRGQPTVAEPAVAVIDEHQGNGAGAILLQRLMQAAEERGVCSFRSEVLATNEGMKSLLEDLSAHATFEQQGDGIVVVNIPIGKVAEPVAVDPTTLKKLNPLQRLLSHVARNRVSVIPGDVTVDGERA